MSTTSSEPLAVIIVESAEAAHDNHQKLFSRLPGVGVVCFTDPGRALQAANTSGCDLMVVSLGNTPDSVAFIKQLRSGQPAVPIIAIPKEREIEKELRQAVYECGVMTFLEQRPIDPLVYLNSARTALSFAMLRRDDRVRIQEAQNKTAGAYAELERREAACLEAIMHAAGLLDPALEARMTGVAAISRQIAQQLRLEDYRRLEAVTKVYDIGMLGIPENLRAKRLDPMRPDDTKIFQSHTTNIAAIFGGTPMGLMGLAWAVASSHHERFDGTGYPSGKAGDQIPIHARIVAVAEAFYDATRPLGGIPPSPLVGLQKVQRAEMTAFDPAVVAGLGKLVEATNTGTVQIGA
jgi:putative two-component system response regulator